MIHETVNTGQGGPAEELPITQKDTLSNGTGTCLEKHVKAVHRSGRDSRTSSATTPKRPPRAKATSIRDSSEGTGVKEIGWGSGG